MADGLLSAFPPYPVELDNTPGEYHDLRIVMEARGALVIPHPELGFGDESQNEVVRSMKGLTAQKIADVLLKKNSKLTLAA